MSIFLETKRLILKAPELSDLDNLVVLRTDPEVMQYIGTGAFQTREQVKTFLDNAKPYLEEYGLAFYSVFEKKTGNFVGQAGLFHLDFDVTQPDIELAYRLNKKYWEDKNSFPFIVRYKNEIAGFVIVDSKGSVAEIDFNMADFFVLRKFKNKGLGRYVAHQCFEKFPGEWEVMVIPGNEGAYCFWRSTIKNYTNNNFTEYTREIAHFNNSRKNIFKFNSRIML